MTFAMPSDDGTIILAPTVLTDHPGKELFAPWRGKARPLSPWKDGLSDVELPRDACPPCDFNLLRTFPGWPMFRPNGNVLTVCLLVFLPWSSLKAFSRPSSDLRWWLFRKQDCPGAAEALLKNRPSPPLRVKWWKLFRFGPGLLLALLVLSYKDRSEHRGLPPKCRFCPTCLSWVSEGELHQSGRRHRSSFPWLLKNSWIFISQMLSFPLGNLNTPSYKALCFDNIHGKHRAGMYKHSVSLAAFVGLWTSLLFTFLDEGNGGIPQRWRVMGDLVCSRHNPVHLVPQVPFLFLFPSPHSLSQSLCFIDIALFDLSIYLFSYLTSRAYVVIFNCVITAFETINRI